MKIIWLIFRSSPASPPRPHGCRDGRRRCRRAAALFDQFFQSCTQFGGRRHFVDQHGRRQAQRFSHLAGIARDDFFIAQLIFINARTPGGLAQVKALEAAEISSQSALDSNKLGYQVGVRINIDVLNAQRQLFSTQTDLSKARYNTIMNGLRLKAAAGSLRESDLVPVNALLVR